MGGRGWSSCLEAPDSSQWPWQHSAFKLPPSLGTAQGPATAVQLCSPVSQAATCPQAGNSCLLWELFWGKASGSHPPRTRGLELGHFPLCCQLPLLSRALDSAEGPRNLRATGSQLLSPAPLSIPGPGTGKAPWFALKVSAELLIPSPHTEKGHLLLETVHSRF